MVLNRANLANNYQSLLARIPDRTLTDSDILLLAIALSGNNETPSNNASNLVSKLSTINDLVDIESITDKLPLISLLVQIFENIASVSAGGVTDGDKGDITVSANGATWTINTNAVTLAKLQQIATASLLGRSTAGTGNAEVISIGSGLSLSGGTLASNINNLPNKTVPSNTDNLIIQQSDGQIFKLSYANLLAAINNKTLLLLNFQGSNGSQAIVDTSPTPKTVQVFGNTQIQSNKGVFDGNGDYLRIAKSQLDISTLTEYTIEIIGRTPSTAAQLIFTTYNLSNTANHLFFQWNLIGNDTTVYFNPSVATNTDVHLALVRSGGQFRFYQDGVQLGSAVTASNFAQGGDLFIGGSPGDPTVGTRWLNATITGIRITNIARYSANFTPPTSFL